MKVLDVLKKRYPESAKFLEKANQNPLLVIERLIDAEAELAALRPLVTALAGYKADEYSDDSFYCGFCQAFSSESETHDPNCPVLKAREWVKK